MALTTDFDGTSLPTGWTVDSPNGGETVTVSDSRVHVTVPSGVTYDSIFSTGSSDGSAGITHDIATSSFDIAVQCDTDPTGTQNLGWIILVFGATTDDAVRFSLYQNTGGPGVVFGYTRSGGSGASLGNDTISQEPPFSGLWQWVRILYDGAGNWELLGSVDGASWTQVMTGVETFTPERFKIGMTSTGTQPGGTVRINQVRDLTGTGVTDLRADPPSETRLTLAALVGDEGELPASWVDDSANTGSISWTGSSLRLSSSLDIDGSRARLAWDGGLVRPCGITARIQFIQSTSTLFVVVGIGVPSGNPSDQYSTGPGYVWELNGSNNRRFLRVDEVFDVTDFEAPYARLLADALGSGTAARRIRVERAGRRIRARTWLDSDPEPSTWDFDGQDEVYDDFMVPVIAASHNDGTSGGTQSVDISDVEFYLLSVRALNGTPAVVTVAPVSGSFDQASLDLVGSPANVTVSAVSGEFSQATEDLVGSPAVVTVSAVSGTFTGSPGTLVGSPAVVTVTARPGSLHQGSGAAVYDGPMTTTDRTPRRTAIELTADHTTTESTAARTTREIR